ERWLRKRPTDIGYDNNEPLVMEDVLAFYTNQPCRPPKGGATKLARGFRKSKKRARDAPGTDPAFVVFLSDGGIDKDDGIKRLLTRAADHPIFWQFVGVGFDGDDDGIDDEGGYGILEHLDSMPGRRVDNAGFFALDDIDSVSDEELYDRLLTEFPLWRQAARAGGVLSD
ncbi:MAG: VWA domain-containing protein, partial [Acidimicrobiia bacterium]